METIAQRIKKRRELLGLTQEELAKILGYKSRSSINKIEVGETDITQSKILAFAQALQCSPAYLMGWEEEGETGQMFTVAFPFHLSEHERNVMIQYHGQPNMQQAVDRLLGLDNASASAGTPLPAGINNIEDLQDYLEEQETNRLVVIAKNGDRQVVDLADQGAMAQLLAQLQNQDK